MKIEPPVVFGDMLRHARRNADLTQEALAELAGISARAISDLERGINRAPRRDTLDLLAGALNLTPEERRAWEQARKHLALHSRASSRTPLRDAQQPKAHFPTPLTTFVGREREIGDVMALLRRTGSRLVTLTGPGGVGKTRLSLAVANEVEDAYVDGVWFVSLAPLNDPGLVLPAVARTLNIIVPASQSTVAALTDALSDKRIMILLDNVEHVVQAAVEIATLVQACPSLTILATSRMPLRLQAEQEYPVSPFDTPDLEHAAALAHLLQYDAVTLFVQRAQSIRPDFQLTNNNAWAVAGICRRLDGIPLAIELAAARIRLLSPQSMLERLDHPLPLLAGGPVDLPVRQQTLRGAIAWSYDLLSPAEQKLFRRLSIFRGGWTLEAAEAVCGGDTILDSLGALVEHSLIRVRESEDSEPRYNMLETIREFGLEQLAASSEGDSVRWQHADYFFALSERAAQRVEDGDQQWLDRLDDERENLRAALDWLRESEETERCLRLVGNLRGLWFHRGSLSEGWAQIESVMGLPGASLPTSARAYALTAAGVLAIWRGDAAASIPLNTEAFAICQALGERTAQPWLIVSQGIAASRLGDDDRAIEYWEQSLALAREVGDRVNAARSLANISGLMIDPRHAGRRQAMLEEALALARASGHPATIHLCLSGLVTCAFDRGSYREAAVGLQETLAISATSGWQWQLAEQLVAAARLAQATGQHASAAHVIGAYDALRERTGMLLSPRWRAQHEQFVTEVRAAMAEGAYDGAWTTGRAMPLERAIAIATDVLAIIAASDTQPTMSPGGDG